MKKIVYLDPGHGGHDPGAVNKALGLKESEMALDVCLKAKRLLDPYVDCRLTRDDDTFLTLRERPAIANDNDADAFVSYHFNSATNKKVPLSHEVYTTRGQNRSDILATLILKHQAALFPEQKSRTDTRDGDPDKEANFAVLRPTDCPSALVEGEFIHTIHGGRLIKTEDGRQRMAQAVQLGILEFFAIPLEVAAPAVGEGDMPAILNRRNVSELRRLAVDLIGEIDRLELL